jgi:ribosomal protein S18 acetylase RimI-like enzyme
MKITIEEVNRENIGDVDQCNGEFVIDSRLVVNVENNVIKHTIIEVPSTKKRYEKEIIDTSIYIDDKDKTIFLAYAEGQIAGQIVLRKNWNRYAFVEDIAVDNKFRKRGIGKELMAEAESWTRKCNLVGIMAETQDNNVIACKFYERCGFRLCGFDTQVYKGNDRDTDEVALYWYLDF